MQSGNEADDEPLRPFLLSAFGPMKEVEPDYVQSNRSGPQKGRNCKDSASESEKEEDESEDPDLVAAGGSAKKPKKIRVKVNKT